jgi:hypothetical protein
MSSLLHAVRWPTVSRRIALVKASRCSAHWMSACSVFSLVDDKFADQRIYVDNASV